MKILIHSNAPWTPSGYGKQARHAGAILKSLGHQVSYSAFQGLGGSPIKWEGSAVYPMGVLPFSPDVIVPYARLAGADLIVSVMDTYMLAPAAAQLRGSGIPFAPLVVTDCVAENGGPSIGDQELIAASGALPAAVSRFGRERLAFRNSDAQAATSGLGHWDVPYVPHAVDVEIFKPPQDRASARAENDTGGQFIIGIAGANSDLMRKGYTEQFAAFQRFARRHKDARLALFTVHDSPRGLRLAEIAHDLGIIDSVMFMPSFEQNAGLLDDDFMAAWYASIDVLSMCSYAEGFGVPLIEAQACGTPVVATDCSAMAELARPAGWLVEGTRYWNAVHRAWWVRPAEDSIIRAWEKAYTDNGSPGRSERAAEFARQYSLEESRKNWASFIRDIEDWKDARA